jgi:hypothetical protein
MYLKLKKGDFIGNTASIVANSFIYATHPTTTLVYDTEGSTIAGTDTREEELTKNAPTGESLPLPIGNLTIFYRLTLISVIIITGLTLLAYIFMAIYWINPTDIQKSAFEGMSTAWKMGLGALVGLLSGKQI